jgi:transposase-like protein
MCNKKRTCSPEFKSKVLLELLSGELTLAQMASKYEITPASLKSWK